MGVRAHDLMHNVVAFRSTRRISVVYVQLSSGFGPPCQRERVPSWPRKKHETTKGRLSAPKIRRADLLVSFIACILECVPKIGQIIQTCSKSHYIHLQPRVRPTYKETYMTLVFNMNARMDITYITHSGMYTVYFSVYCYQCRPRGQRPRS